MTAATTTLNPGVGGDLVLADTLTTVDGAAAPASARAQFVKFGWGGASELFSVTLAAGLPVQFTWAGLTNAQLRAAPVPILGLVEVSNPTALGLTDTQLRAAVLPVSLTSTTITGSVATTGAFFQATQPVSAVSLPLPAGAATQTTLAAINDKLPTVGIKAAAASLPVVAAQGTPTSRAGTITTGGTAQQLAAANAARTGVLVQNNSAGDLRVAVTTTASATVGARVAPGQMLVLLQPFCGTGAISIWGATTAQEFHALETV